MAKIIKNLIQFLSEETHNNECNMVSMVIGWKYSEPFCPFNQMSNIDLKTLSSGFIINSRISQYRE